MVRFRVNIMVMDKVRFKPRVRYRVGVRFRMRVSIMIRFRVKVRVRVGMVFRVKVWFCPSILWRVMAKSFQYKHSHISNICVGTNQATFLETRTLTLIAFVYETDTTNYVNNRK